MSRSHVHLTSDIYTAYDVSMRRRNAEAVICVIDAKAMFDEGYVFYITKNNVWLTEYVPLEYVTFIEIESIEDLDKIKELFN